jgi:hypothetical protein
MLRRFVSSMALLTVGVLVGCGSGVKPEVVPPLHPVSGKVTLDGKPIDKVAVTFVPAENNKGNGGSGSTDAEGRFNLKYRNGEDGIPAGDYIMVCTKLTMPDGSPIPEGQTAADVMAVDQIPERYRKVDNPRNAVSVPEGGKEFVFDLKSK